MQKKKNRVWNCIVCNDNVLYDIINNPNIFSSWLMHKIYEMNENALFLIKAFMIYEIIMFYPDCGSNTRCI